MAAAILARQRANPTPYVLRLQQNYGPEGNALILVGLAGVFLENVLILVGGALVVASNGNGSLASLASYYWCQPSSWVCFAASGESRVYGQGAGSEADVPSYGGARFSRRACSDVEMRPPC